MWYLRFENVRSVLKKCLVRYGCLGFFFDCIIPRKREFQELEHNDSDTAAGFQFQPYILRTTMVSMPMVRIDLKNRTVLCHGYKSSWISPDIPTTSWISFTRAGEGTCRCWRHFGRTFFLMYFSPFGFKHSNTYETLEACDSVMRHAVLYPKAALQDPWCCAKQESALSSSASTRQRLHMNVTLWMSSCYTFFHIPSCKWFVHSLVENGRLLYLHIPRWFISVGGFF